MGSHVIDTPVRDLPITPCSKGLRPPPQHALSAGAGHNRGAAGGRRDGVWDARPWVMPPASGDIPASCTGYTSPVC